MQAQHNTVLAYEIKSTSTSSKYRHTRLRSTKRHIRLLRVWRKKDGPIQCDLREFCLGNHGRRSMQRNANCPEGCPAVSPNFIAVSYEWGPVHPSKVIEINGQSFVARRNLWCLLKNIARGRLPYASNKPHVLRDKVTSLMRDKGIGKGNVYLWVDQICIDQTSAREKTAQIMLMKTIYGTAERVIAWIGPGDDGSHQAMDYIQNRSANRVTWPKDATYKYVSIDPNCQQMRHLAGQTYWTRLWVVQEIAAARRVVIIWGRRQAEYGDWVMQRFKQDNHDRHLDRLLNTATWMQRTPGSLLYLCCHFIDHKCMLPHDQVFALCSFCEPADRPLVDYTRKPCELFWDLVLLHGNGHGYIIIRKLLRFAHAMGVTGREDGAQMADALLIFRQQWFSRGHTPQEIFAMDIEKALGVSQQANLERDQMYLSNELERRTEQKLLQ